MTLAAGVDFGTLNVRVSIVDSNRGVLGSALADYPLHRKNDDPEYATQSHDDHMSALVNAMRQAIVASGTRGEQVASIALDTTGSSVIPVADGMIPLDEYYLWCDHRAKNEAAEITERALREQLAAIKWCGGVYSSEWGFSKLLHWLRYNPDKRDSFASAFEHCDMVAATLCGVSDPRKVKRSICAMGHKWMWNAALGGLPPETFLARVDPLFAGIRAKLESEHAASDQIAGGLSSDWAAKLGLRSGIPIPVGALDAHWDAIGAGAKEGDVVNVIGTSTCIISYVREAELIPGVCGVVRGSVHPQFTGIEAGLSATGDIFGAICRRANSTISDLTKNLERYHPGQTGLMRITWDNGDRTVLVNPNLGGITLGWKLHHSAEDELFAAIEGTAFHTRIILDRMSEHGARTRRVINGGGIPQNNPVLNQIYANVLGKPVLVPTRRVTGLGSAIFALLAAGAFATIDEGQDKLCPTYTEFTPQAHACEIYNELYALYREVYFAFGKPSSEGRCLGEVLPVLSRLAGARQMNQC